MKKLIALVLSLAIGTILLAGCAANTKNSGNSGDPGNSNNSSSDNSGNSGGSGGASASEKRAVLLVKKLSSSYWTEMVDAAQAKCDEYGWKLEVLCPVTADSNEEQIELLEQSLLTPPDIYLIAPADASAIAPAIEQINDAGIPIICVTNKIADGCGDYVTYVGVQYFDIAAAAAQALVEHLDGKGNILFIEGTTGSSTSIDINDGAKSILEHTDGITILDSQPANYQRTEALTVTQNLLQKYSDVDAIFASNGEMAMGAVEAVRQAGREDEIVVSALNCSEELVQAIYDGKLLFTADDVSWKMGEEAVVAAKDYFDGKDLEKEMMCDAVIVTKDDMQSYIDRYHIE